MDLKLQEVAALLNVPVASVQQWLADGLIPAYRLRLQDQQWRFNRSEIERWLLRGGIHQDDDAIPDDESPSLLLSKGSDHFGLYRALHKGLVLTEVNGNNKEDLIRNTMAMVSEELNLDAEGISDLLIDRENLEPTAIGKGVALPHTRDFLLGRPYDLILVSYPSQPIPYGAIDGLPVHTLFFLFASSDRRHLRLLTKLAHFLRSPKAFSLLQTKPDKLSLLQSIKEWESGLLNS